MTPLPPLPDGFVIENQPEAYDPMKDILSSGYDFTNGYRTEQDIEDLRRRGYKPAKDSRHLDGDAIDLVPGKSGKSMAEVRAYAAQILDKWGRDKGRVIDEGDHVHLQLYGWGQAPGTPGTPYSGMPDLPDGFTVEQRGPVSRADLTHPVSPADYSEMAGDRTSTVPLAPGSTTRQAVDPEGSAMLDQLIRSGASYGDAMAAMREKYPQAPPGSPGEYAAAQAYHAKHPDYKGSFGEVMSTVPLSEAEQSANNLAQSKTGVAVGRFTNAMTAGLPVALAGEEGNYWEALSNEQHPNIGLAADLAGNVAGAVIGGKAVGAGARALAEGESVAAPAAAWVASHPGITQTGVDLAMGAGYGAAQAGPGHRLEGAAYGAAATAALEGAGRAILSPAAEAATGLARRVFGKEVPPVPEGFVPQDALEGPLPREASDLASGQPEAPGGARSAAMAADEAPSIASEPVRQRDVIDTGGLNPQPGTPEQRAAAAAVQPEDVLNQANDPIRGLTLEQRARRVGVAKTPDESDDAFIARLESVENAGREMQAAHATEAPAPFSAGAHSDPPIAPQESPDLSAVAKAGNINLDKIETEHDIDALMKFTADSFGDFKAERRGVQKWEATQKLAEDLGMTPDDLLSRQTGEAFNAEHALAARNLLAASATETRKLADAAVSGSAEVKAAFVKSFLLHAAIAEKASGAAAEAGRALNIYAKVAKAGLGDTAAMQDALRRLQNGATVEDVAAMVNSLADDPSALNRFARDAIKPAFKDKLMFVWINSLLSGPKTHIVNMTSNLVTAAMEMPELATAAAIGGARRALGGKGDAVLASELGPRFYGMVRGGAEGLTAAKEGFMQEAGGKLDAPRPAIGGKAGAIISLPTRLLNAEDEFFKAMARRSELAGMAVRKANGEGLKGDKLRARVSELLAYPTDDMMSAAAEASLYKTFQRPLGPAMQKVSAAIQNTPVLKLFVPFIRTPTNLLKYALERSPAAPLLKEVRQDFIAGGAKRDLAIARMTLGTGIGSIVAGLAAQGRITGNGPADPSAKRALEANGWQPYSIKVGDEYVSYRRLDPWATIIGTAADAVELQSAMTEKQANDAGAIIVGAMTQNLASKTWLSGLSDLIDTITDPKANAKNTITRLAASIATPTLSSQIAQMTDPVMRDTNDPSYMGAIRKRIESRVPGLSENLIPRRDILGKELRDQGGPLDRLLSPFDTKSARNDPVAKAIYDSGARFSPPSRNVGGGRLPDEAYDAYQQVAAQRFYDAMKETLADPEWQALTREERAKEIERLKNSTRKDAREELFGL